MRIDLFRLHDGKLDRTPHSWILMEGAGLTSIVQKLLSEVCTKSRRRKLDKVISKELNISDISAQRLRRNRVRAYPIPFILKLIAIWKRKLRKDGAIVKKIKAAFLNATDQLRVNTSNGRKLKALKEITPEFCKIAGAHAADGTLYRNYFCISDGYNCNLKAFARWVEKAFGIKPKIKNRENREWKIVLHNKIFARYLNKIMMFPSGKKVYSTGEPTAIQKSRLELRKAFAGAALLFEAGIGIKPCVELCVASKRFRDDLADILRESGIKFITSNNSRYYRLWTKPLTKEEANKWLQLIEKETWKEHRLKCISCGYFNQVKNLGDFRKSMDRAFPKKPANKVTITDVVDVIVRKKEACRYEIAEELKKKNRLKGYGGIWAHGLAPYLRILKKSNFILVKKKKFGKKKSFGSIVREVYVWNANPSLWRTP